MVWDKRILSSILFCHPHFVSWLELFPIRVILARFIYTQLFDLDLTYFSEVYGENVQVATHLDCFPIIYNVNEQKKCSDFE